MVAEPIKRPWNSLEVIKLVAAVLTPFAIWRVGVWATNESTSTEREHTKNMAEIAYDRSRKDYLESKDLEITKTYVQAMQDKVMCNREAQVSLVIALATPGLADRLRNDFSITCSKSEDPAASSEKGTVRGAVVQSKIAAIKTSLSNLEGLGNGIARSELRNQLQESPELAAPLLADALATNSRNYKITLGVLVALGSVNSGWKGDGELLKQFKLLRGSPNMRNKTFEEWYARAEKNII